METLRHRELPLVQGPVYAAEWRRREAFPAHSHDFHEIALITAGRGRQLRQGGEDELAPGSLVVLAPGDWHAYRHAGEMAGLDCAYDPALVHRELAWTAGDPRLGWLLWRHRSRPAAMHLRLAAAAAREAREHLQALSDLTHRDGDTHAAQVGRLLCLLGLVAQHLDVPAEAPQIHPIAAAAARLMEQDPAQPWTLAGLALRTGAARGYLCRVFARDLGAPPLVWLIRRRIRAAQALLMRSDLPVADIAAKVGWSDANLFARRFRAETGLSATAWRRRYAAASPS